MIGSKENLFSATNKVATDAPGRPLARYPGSKNRLATWIINHIPGHHDTFILPTVGMGATLFKKVRSGIEVINDKNLDVINLFEMVRTRFDELIHLIQFTPWSGAILEENTANPVSIEEDPLKRAWQFYCHLWMSMFPYESADSDRVYFRNQMKYSRGSCGTKTMVPAAKLFADIDHLTAVCDRLRGVIIEPGLDAIEVIRKYAYDRSCIYIDPPYVLSTRQRKQHYKYEMSLDYHKELGVVLNDIPGYVLLSGYQSQLYTDMFESKGWMRLDKTNRTQGADRIECLWLNHATQKALIEERAMLEEQEELERVKEPQLSLFDFE